MGCVLAVAALFLAGCGARTSEQATTVPSSSTTTSTTEQTTPRLGPILQFSSPTAGWFADPSLPGQILGTTDGGRSWWTSYSGSFSEATDSGWVLSLDFVNTSDGWALLQDRGLVATTDGGRTWSSPTEPLEGQIVTFVFSGPDDGWAITSLGTLLSSSDAGRSWRVDKTPEHAIALCSASGTVWFSGPTGNVYVSDDGGPWTLSLAGSSVPDVHNSVGPNPIPQQLWIACQAGTAWALYNYGSAAGSTPYVLERTLDGGTSWASVLGAEVVPEPSGTPAAAGGALVDFGVSGPSSAWLLTYCAPCAAGMPAIVTTTNGSTFSSTYFPIAEGVYAEAIDAAFSDQANGWAVLSEYPSSEPGQASLQTTVVLATHDGGSTWEVVDPSLKD